MTDKTSSPAASDPVDSAESSPDEARRTLALTLAVELRRSPGDVTAGHVTRTARAFEAYLRNGTVER